MSTTDGQLPLLSSEDRQATVRARIGLALPLINATSRRAVITAHFTPHEEPIDKSVSRIPIYADRDLHRDGDGPRQRAIYLGGAYCLNADAEFQEICTTDVSSANGILVIYACTEQERERSWLPHTISRLREGYEVDYRNLNFADTADTKIDNHILDSSLVINDAINRNKLVFIYCGMGISRSSSLLIGYFILAYNLPYTMALEYVRHYRNKVEPNYTFCYELGLISGLRLVIDQREEGPGFADLVTEVRAALTQPAGKQGLPTPHDGAQRRAGETCTAVRFSAAVAGSAPVPADRSGSAAAPTARDVVLPRP